MCKVINIKAKQIFDEMNTVCSDVSIEPLRRIAKLAKLKKELNKIGHDVEACDSKPETPDIYFKLITL